MTANPPNSSATGIRALPGRLARALDFTEVAVLCGAVALLALMVIANVFARMLHQSMYFVEEVSRFLIILITFVGTSYATRRARHIRMGAFLDLMPDWLEKIFVIFISTVSAVVFLVMARHAWHYLLEVKRMDQTTSALRAPYWTFLMILPVGFFASGVQCLRTVAKNLVEKEVWLSADQQSEYEELVSGDES